MTIRSALYVGLLLVFGASSAFATLGLHNLGAGASPTGVTTDGSAVAFNLGGANIWYSSTGLSANIGTAYTTAGIAYTTYNAPSGKYVVGGNSGGNAFRYDSDTGLWTQLPLEGGTKAWTARCTSAGPGDVFIGGNTGTTTGGRKHCRYKESTNSTSTSSYPPSGNNDGYIFGASDIGTFAGRAQYGAVSPSGSRQAMAGPLGSLAWMRPLIGGTSTGNESVANCISRDGTKAGGWSTAPGVSRGLTLWTIATPLEPFQIPFTGTYNYGEVQALNRDGTIAAGYQQGIAPNPVLPKAAFIWESGVGTQDLATYLAGKGVGVAGWTFSDVLGMSGDGKILTGLGTFNTVASGWVVVIPEPSSLCALAVGLLGLLKLRRRA